MGLLEAALAASPADETELVWLDTTRQRVAAGKEAAPPRRLDETTLLVRVLERGRLGTFRCGGVDASGVEGAIRQAMAQSRTRDTLQGLPHFPAEPDEAPRAGELCDAAIVELTPEGANERLAAGLGKGVRAGIDWGITEMLVANSRGLRRRAKATDVSLSLSSGRRPGAGHAAASSRALVDLDPEALLERAERRRGGGELTAAPADKTTLLLAPEATVRLLDLLNSAAFTASAYQQGESLLREHLGVQVFDRRIHLRDDGTDPSGLPFPFDFEGTLKRPVELIVKGTPKTPALDQRQAAVLGLQPTGHAVAGNDAAAQHLFLMPGEDSHDALLERAEGGLFVGWIERLECFDASRLRFRAEARGVRVVRKGRLAATLPDLIWEDSLLRVLSSLGGLGSETVTWSLGGFGAYSAPALALVDVTGLRPTERR